VLRAQPSDSRGCFSHQVKPHRPRAAPLVFPLSPSNNSLLRTHIMPVTSTSSSQQQQAQASTSASAAAAAASQPTSLAKPQVASRVTSPDDGRRDRREPQLYVWVVTINRDVTNEVRESSRGRGSLCGRRLCRCSSITRCVCFVVVLGGG